MCLFNESYVQFVCMGGTSQRMESFAYYIADIIGEKLPADGKLVDLSQQGQRYALYKVGPVLSVSVSHKFIKIRYKAYFSFVFTVMQHYAV